MGEMVEAVAWQGESQLLEELSAAVDVLLPVSTAKQQPHVSVIYVIAVCGCACPAACSSTARQDVTRARNTRWLLPCCGYLPAPAPLTSH